MVNNVKRLFVKKLKISYSSNYPIMLEFCQLVVNIVVKEYHKWYFEVSQLAKVMKTQKSLIANFGVKS